MKENQNLGITKACQNTACKRELFRDFEVKGWFFKLKIKLACPHCGEKWEVSLEQKTVVKITKVVLPILIGAAFLVGFSIEKITAKKPTLNCSTFDFQEEAQALFNTDPMKYKMLDKNNDNEPCEHLPKSTNYTSDFLQ